jgi:hypothetical protein
MFTTERGTQHIESSLYRNGRRKHIVVVFSSVCEVHFEGTVRVILGKLIVSKFYRRHILSNVQCESIPLIQDTIFRYYFDMRLKFNYSAIHITRNEPRRLEMIPSDDKHCFRMNMS